MHDAGRRDAGRSEDLSKSNWVAYHWRENNDPLQSREMKFSSANGDRETLISPVQRPRAGLATLPG